MKTSGKKHRKMVDSQKIIIFFAIFIVIFAICLIGIGANLLMKVRSNEPKNEGNITQEPNTPQENPTEPNINITFEGGEPGQVKVIVASDKDIQNIDYWWDDEAPTTVQPNDKKYEMVISSKQGTHKLNVEVTDIDGNKKTSDQLVIGDSVPELQLGVDGVSNYVIKATDDEQIKKIVIVLNGETQEIEVNEKEFEYKVPIPEGDSVIEVTAYNLNGLSVNKKGKVNNFRR